jgi:anti-anti-sigma factor
MVARKVFLTERQGATLVVTPARETLDVMESDLRREIESLHQLMDAPGVQNVVIDVGNSPHYGSLVIGALMALCQKARDRGGAAAFCNASDGMLDMLDIMKITSVLPYCKSRDEAIAMVRAKA